MVLPPSRYKQLDLICPGIVWRQAERDAAAIELTSAPAADGDPVAARPENIAAAGAAETSVTG